MVANKTPITKGGFAKLEKELALLKTQDRPAVIKAIGEARAHGDLSENAEYHAAKEKQGFIEGKIQNLESKIARAEIIDESLFTGEIVRFGATVTLFEESNGVNVVYKLVGEYEADIENMLLSVNTPLGRALIGKKIGDCVEINTPKGEKIYKVLSIKFN